MAESLAQIERERLKAGISVRFLERSADIAPDYYYALLAGKRQAKPGTLARLKLAIKRHQQGQPGNDVSLVNATYRIACAMVARSRGADPLMVLSQDPGRRATQSADWMAAAQVREQAIYLMNAALGIRQADIARAVGLSKGAISYACARVEDRRDDATFDQELDRFEREIVGEF